MNQQIQLKTYLGSANDLIDLQSLVPEMINIFSISIEKEHILNNFQMQIDKDGSKLVDKKGFSYDLNTSHTHLFENNKGNIIQISEGVVRPEFEVNSHNLIFTLYVKDIQLGQNSDELKKETPNKESLSARFKIFDMENQKDKENLYQKSHVIKKALVRKHSHSQITEQGANLWVTLTENYKEQTKAQKKQVKKNQRMSAQKNASSSKSAKKDKQMDEELKDQNEGAVSVAKDKKREIQPLQSELVQQQEKQQEYKRKIEKLQKNVLKKEFLYYIGSCDFQKNPEVRNAVLPRDTEDIDKLKQYQLNVVKHLVSQYK